MSGEQLAIERVVIVAKKGDRPAVAALGDMVRVAGKDSAGEASHAGALALSQGTVN